MNPSFPSNSAQKVSNIWNNDYAVADEGNYYVSLNPTVGTAIAMTTSVVDDAATASSTHAQFAPVMQIVNGDVASNANARSIYPRYLRMSLAQVPTSATIWRYAMRLDSGSKYASGGSQITPVNVNPGSSNNPVARIYFGAIVPTSLPTSNSHLVASGFIDTTIPVTGDQWLFTFGNASPSMDQLNGGTVAKNMVFNCPPIIIPPNWTLQIEMWGTANAAAPSWEFEMGHIERIPGL